jgi:hypothetical protein
MTLVNHPTVRALLVTIAIALMSTMLLTNVVSLTKLVKGAEAVEANREYLLEHVRVHQWVQRELSIYARDALAVLCEETGADCPQAPTDIEPLPRPRTPRRPHK